MLIMNTLFNKMFCKVSSRLILGVIFSGALLFTHLFILPAYGSTGLIYSLQDTGRSELFPLPVDMQIVRDQDDMTWVDYKPIPDQNWADPDIKPTKKTIRIAILAADFEDQPFVMTMPKHSDMYGNPQIDPVEREDIAMFYNDFWNKPQSINNYQTINGFWMEQSFGKYGIETQYFGPYRMPAKSFQYGLQGYGQSDYIPEGYDSHHSLYRDIDSLWVQSEGDSISKDFDIVLRIFAGYDETCVWQEFGEMKFLSKESVPREWGNPDTTKPNWAPTRYIPWTSWRAAKSLWANSAIITGECSGAIRHEISHHAFRIGDNNNNPYIEPYRRVASGPWDLMDRGSFNGPGGPHRRWLIPVTEGGAMPAGLMLRQKLLFEFVSEDQVLKLGREEIASEGIVVARVTAREVEPLKNEYAGITVRLDGQEPHDRTPFVNPLSDPLSPGIPDYDFYSLEVIQRMGYDSFCPDNGVLIAMNKDTERTNGGQNGFRCFNWVIDAHPEDILKVDFIRPDGTEVMRTIADYRQLNDALFHAGLNSGSKYEYADLSNKLHFYVIDISKNEKGILSYTLGIRSLDNKPGKADHSIEISQDKGYDVVSDTRRIYNFSIRSTGKKSKKPEHYNSDIYRLSVSIKDGRGWTAALKNGLIALNNLSEIKDIPVYISTSDRSSENATLIITAISESNPEISSSYSIGLTQ